MGRSQWNFSIGSVWSKTHNGDRRIFIITSVNDNSPGRVMNGDSIRIDAGIRQNVVDPAGNNQDNPWNIQRKIGVTVVVKKKYLLNEFDLVIKTS
jgi:hypothetical protein